MKKETTYNEAIDGDEGFVKGEGYPSCEGEPCVNLADEGIASADTMAGEGAAQSDTSGKEADAVEAAAAEAAAWKDKFLRLQAEFDNYRKRTLREKMELVETGGKEVLKAMLPVRDDVERALVAMTKSDDIEALREGVRLIAQKFTETLRQRGVTEIEAQGKPFDPDRQEAVAKFAAGAESKGCVIEVVQAGYMLGDNVLRFAKVVVGE